jgi:putative endonuclease
MKNTYAIGLVAEVLCILRLWLTGWRVLARRYKHPTGEVDIIATRAKVVAFIEVKARSSRRAAIESIHPAQQARIRRAAQSWLSRHPQFSGHESRFDVMLLTHWPWPHRLKNMF